jgi:hypothetical protein
VHGREAIGRIKQKQCSSLKVSASANSNKTVTQEIKPLARLKLREKKSEIVGR